MREPLVILCLAVILTACGPNENSGGSTVFNDSDTVVQIVDNTTESPGNTKGHIRSRIKLDQNGDLQTCTGVNDPTCNAQGPDQRLACDPDGYCHLYESDELCVYPGLEGGPKQCAYLSCANDSECLLGAPQGTMSSCISTQSSSASDIPGVCLYVYPTCTVLPGTPCSATGVTYCSDNQCSCTAQADMTKAQPETCDGVDNDCDGIKDNGFDIGQSCDGADSDMCKNGTWTCAPDKLSHECVNETTTTGIVEVCDGLDNDCDGQIDEDFPLNKACDGADSDMCKNGTWTCKPDTLGVECVNETGSNHVETCNGLDDDCNGQTDENFGVGVVCDGADLDSCKNGTFTCTADGAETECINEVGSNHVETCNGLDDDCNGVTDDSFPVGQKCDGNDSDSCANGTWTCKTDGSGAECVNESTQNIVETCNGLDDDCNGKTDETFPIGKACDGADSDLCANGTWTCKTDGSGAECANENPMNITESCNGADDDCDGQIDEDFPTLGAACDGPDADSCKNGKVVCTMDGNTVMCDETGKNVVEICNGVDDTCDGVVDEGCDDDKDGYCDSSMTVAPGAKCLSGDCNDSDPSINPAATEFCDGVDNNCDTFVDPGYDLGDACTAGSGVCKTSGTRICSTNGLTSVCSAQPDMSQQLSFEICNGKDDTCNGAVDEGCDDDGDGYCDTSMPMSAGATCLPGDCNDASASIHPGATEICNGADDTCNGAVDEGCDADGDGWCTMSMTVTTGATCTAGDCNDTDKNVNPGMDELCSTSYDDNCDGDTVFKKDGTTLACDSCANKLKLKPNTPTTLTMGDVPNNFNLIDSYQCWTNIGAFQIKTKLPAAEIMAVLDAPAGTKFSVKITAGTPSIVALLHGSCEPNAGTSAVTAYHPPTYNGTCSGYGSKSVSGGVAGQDTVVIDATANTTVTVELVVVP